MSRAWIMTVIDKVEHAASVYRKRVPKVIRFILFYGLSPVWFPALFIAVVVLCIVGKVCEGIADMYNDFDKE